MTEQTNGETAGATPEPRWVGRGQAARLLGVSRRRLRRLVRDGQLSAPQSRAGEGSGWSRAELAALADTLAGRVASVNASKLAAAPVALTRTLDRVVDDEIVLGVSETVTQQLHVRVWDGPAPEGRRVVVVVGALPGAVIDRLEVPARIAARWLPVPAPEAVWVLFRAPHGDGALSRLEGLVCHWDHDHPYRLRSPKYVAPGGSAARADTQPVTFSQLEAVIGEPVECYPGAAYTAQTIARFARHGHTVDVAHDDLGLDRFTSAISTLDDAANSVEPADPARAADARDAATLLADEIRTRWELRAGVAHDGTSTGTAGSLDRASGQEPRRWAARIVPVTAGPEDKGMLERYPDPFPVGPARRGDRQTLLARWWDWADETGPHADRPDPELHSALTAATNLLDHWLTALNRLEGQHEVRERPHRPCEVRTYTVRGDTDQDFLDGLTPADPLGQPGAGAPLRRRARAVAGPFTGHRRWALHELWFGFDHDGHLVAAEPRPAAGCSSRDYAAEWPLGPLARPLPDDAVLVADAAIGDRPVYIRWPDRTLSPLPGRLDGQTHAGWNFGYSGSGPGHLAEDIITHLPDPTDEEHARRHRVRAELSRDHHRSRLAVPVRALTTDLTTDLTRDMVARPPGAATVATADGRDQIP